jgi:hypothetical protein
MIFTDKSIFFIQDRNWFFFGHGNAKGIFGISFFKEHKRVSLVYQMMSLR